MANPVLVTCIKDQWTKVATNVTKGQIHKVDNTQKFILETYKLTGQAAPVGKSTGRILFDSSEESEKSAVISSSDAIDVYLWSEGSNSIVRVDV